MGEIHSLRGELKSEINTLRGELKGEINALRAEVRADAQFTNTALAAICAHMGIELPRQ